MDYYAVLGIARDAEDVVITAAYKAMVKKYHPDVYTGSKAEANKKIREINEAYDTLSDPKKRAAYDKSTDSEGQGVGDYERYNEDEDLAAIVREDDWAIIVEFYPEAETERKQLESISKKAAIYYQLILLELKAGSKWKEFASVTRNYFMERYFGSNKQLHSIVYALLKMGKKDIAKEINRAVKVLGDDSSDDIIKNFKKKHGKLFTATHIVTAPFHRYKNDPATLSWHGQAGERFAAGDPIFHVQVEKTGQKLVIKAERPTTLIERFKPEGYHVTEYGEELGLIVH